MPLTNPCGSAARKISPWLSPKFSKSWHAQGFYSKALEKLGDARNVDLLLSYLEKSLSMEKNNDLEFDLSEDLPWAKATFYEELPEQAEQSADIILKSRYFFNEEAYKKFKRIKNHLQPFAAQKDFALSAAAQVTLEKILEENLDFIRGSPLFSIPVIAYIDKFYRDAAREKRPDKTIKTEEAIAIVESKLKQYVLIKEEQMMVVVPLAFNVSTSIADFLVTSGEYKDMNLSQKDLIPSRFMLLFSTLIKPSNSDFI